MTKVKKSTLRKRQPQIPVNYPAPDVIPFDYELEKSRTENLCKRLADNEADVRNAVLAELPRYIKEVCATFALGDVLEQYERGAAANVALTGFGAGTALWAALLGEPSVAQLSLVLEKLALGLFYCLWHTDKPIPQHECAQKLVDLLDAPPTPLLKDLMLRAVLRSLAARWGTIDKWRVDKYMTWVRKLCFWVMCYLERSVSTAAETLPSKHNKSDSAKEVARIATHPTLLRTAATFQNEVFACETAVGLTMHICDIVLTEMIRCGRLGVQLFVAVAVAIPINAMQRGDFVEKRVMDNFVVPIAAGVLEQQSAPGFSLEVAAILSHQFRALSLSRQTHFSVRPLMVESQRLMDNYVGLSTNPELYESVHKRDERRRMAEEILAAEDVKMKMARTARKIGHRAHEARTATRKAKALAAPPKSKRSPRWKK